MSHLIKLRCLSSKATLLFKLNNFESKSLIIRTISNSKALQSGFARDFKPGPYPKTEAERIAAAKKYGMRFLLIY